MIPIFQEIQCTNMNHGINLLRQAGCIVTRKRRPTNNDSTKNNHHHDDNIQRSSTDNNNNSTGMLTIHVELLAPLTFPKIKRMNKK